MGFFGFRKKEKFLDLSEKFKKQKEGVSKPEIVSTDNSSQELPSQGVLGFFGSMANSASSNESSESSDEKKQKLTKRLMDITDRLEDLSNQIYHLQQRVELLERKMGTGSY